MKLAVVLLAVVSALALATVALAVADPGPITGDATSFSNAISQGWNVSCNANVTGDLFSSGIAGEGNVQVWTYYQDFVETTPEPGFPSGEGAVRMWDYVVKNNTINPTNGGAPYLLRSFSITYAGSGVPVPDVDDMDSSAPSWLASTSGTSVNWATTAGSGAEIVGGGVKQFLVETRQTAIGHDSLPASVQNGHAYNGFVCGPVAVPEPMSMLLGCLGLTSIAGFRRLRR